MNAVLSVDQVALIRNLMKIGKLTPQAVVKALNSVAYEARQDIVTGLDDTFTVRRRGFITRGIRYEKATPLNLTAIIGTIDRYLAEHDPNMGVNMRPGLAGKMRAIPYDARPSITDVTPRSKWPGPLARKSGYFFQNHAKMGLTLYKRVGKERLPIRVVYRFTAATKMPQQWDMVDTVAKVADNRLLDALIREFDKALEKARTT